jgi:hypothetical protein
MTPFPKSTSLKLADGEFSEGVCMLCTAWGNGQVLSINSSRENVGIGGSIQAHRGHW